MRVTMAEAKWQPDPKTIEWLAKELEWEIENQDDAGPAAMASAVPACMRRVKRDKKRLAESRRSR